MTNLEWIQSMSREELADFLCGYMGAESCSEITCPGYDYCRMRHKGLLDWLSMEADEYIE